MILRYSISGVTNPLENHSCSMILPYCSIEVITTNTLPNLCWWWKANMLEKGRHQIAVNLSLQVGKKHSLATYLEPQIFFKKTSQMTTSIPCSYFKAHGKTPLIYTSQKRNFNFELLVPSKVQLQKSETVFQPRMISYATLRRLLRIRNSIRIC